MNNSTHPVAALLCLLGFFLHMVLSDPLLNSLGWHYSGDEGAFYEKIHPGTVCIFLSFFALLWGRGNPLRQSYIIYKEHTIFSALLVVYVLLFCYMAARSGFAGLAFILDTHMSAVLCAIALSYAPPAYCARAVHFFIFMAVLNSLIGIGESLYGARLFTFDPTWIVLKERYFRASALLGHPLNNAMFTCVALFTSLSLRARAVFKLLLIIIFVTSLVAFGGRAALIFSIIGLGILGAAYIRKRPSGNRLQTLSTLSMIILAPACLAGGLYLLSHTPIASRIAHDMTWDQSANSRLLSVMVFHYMSAAEIMFGVPMQRVMDIAWRINLVAPLSDIENPWLLMFMMCGLVTFPFWLGATLAFIVRLMKNQSAALQLAVLAYFITASTSNSFGRKDSNYAMMVCAVICAGRSLHSQAKKCLQDT